MKNENEVKFLIQKAEMALLAGRYHEAQETYEGRISKNKNP